MDKPENVRIAGKDDVEALYWHLWGDYWPENNGLGIPASPKAILAMAQQMCALDNCIAGVIDGPHGIMASIGIGTFEAWWSTQTHLTQKWFYVAPYARNSQKYYHDLFAFADWFRDDMSRKVGYAMILENTVLSEERLPAKIRLWRRNAGAQIGATFWSRGDNGAVQNIQAEEHPKPDADAGAVANTEPKRHVDDDAG